MTNKSTRFLFAMRGVAATMIGVAIALVILSGCVSDHQQGRTSPRRTPDPRGCIRECETKYGYYPDRFQSCRDVCIKYAR